MEKDSGNTVLSVEDETENLKAVKKAAKKLKDRQDKEETEPETVFFRLINRTCTLLFLQLLILFVLYAAGNFSQFLDSTLEYILHACVIISLLLAVLSLCGIVSSVVSFCITRKKRNWIYFALYLLLIIFCAVIFAFSRLVTFISAGL